MAQNINGNLLTSGTWAGRWKAGLAGRPPSHASFDFLRRLSWTARLGSCCLITTLTSAADSAVHRVAAGMRLHFNVFISYANMDPVEPVIIHRSRLWTVTTLFSSFIIHGHRQVRRWEASGRTLTVASVLVLFFFTQPTFPLPCFSEEPNEWKSPASHLSSRQAIDKTPCCRWCPCSLLCIMRDFHWARAEGTNEEKCIGDELEAEFHLVCGYKKKTSRSVATPSTPSKEQKSPRSDLKNFAQLVHLETLTT